MVIRLTFRLLVLAALACPALPAHAGVTEFIDRAEWEGAVGQFSTIDFTGFPKFAIITDQYQHLGVTFTDGTDRIRFSNAFPNDNWGLGGNGDIHLSFDRPQVWIGVDFPGAIRVLLFSGGELIHFSSIFAAHPVGGFGGLVSTELFDAVVILDPFDAVSIDDLHFGVPAPSALPLIALLGGWLARRRPRDG